MSTGDPIRGRWDNESLDTSPPTTRATAAAKAEATATTTTTTTTITTTQHILEAAVQFGI